jgi:hypothetical protein
MSHSAGQKIFIFTHGSGPQNQIKFRFVSGMPTRPILGLLPGENKRHVELEYWCPAWAQLGCGLPHENKNNPHSTHTPQKHF